MRSTSSEPQEPYFCPEPWIGILSIETNRDVTFCPCYLKMTVGNLDESSMQDVWNSPTIVGLRRSFSQGILPEPCRGQLCPIVLREELDDYR